MIREAIVDDYELLNKYYMVAPSPENLKVINPFGKIMVFEDHGKVKAFIYYSDIYDRIEINYILTIDNYRHQRIASKLLEYLIKEAVQKKYLNISLEVAKSNTMAILLYQKFQFKEVAIRKDYYPTGDGILMVRELMNDE